FLNHIPASIRINSVLKGIDVRLLSGIDRIYPEPNRGARRPAHGDGIPILAAGSGYVEVLDFARLREVTSKHGGKVVMTVRPGDFVHPSVTIAYWCAEGPAEDASPLEDEVRDCLALGSSRTPHQDLQFLIDE